MKLLFIASMFAAVFAATSVTAGLYKAETALGVLRSIPVPASYSVMCDTLEGAVDLYVFLDELEDGGDFPETAVADYKEALVAACRAGLGAASTWDFHAGVVEAAQRALDGHTGWVSPKSFYEPYDFVLPYTLAFEATTGTTGLVTDAAGLRYTLKRNPIFWAAVGSAEGAAQYAAIVGSDGLTDQATLEAAVGAELTAIDGVAPASWLHTKGSAYGGQRTDGQRAATVGATFGHFLLQKYLSPKYLLDHVAAPAIQLQTSAGTLTVRAVAVAGRDIASLEALEFPTAEAEAAALEPSYARAAVGAEDALAMAAGAAPQPAGTIYELGSATGEVLSAGTFVRAFRVVTGTDDRDPLLSIQISLFAPSLENAGPGDAENQWLEEFDAAMRALERAAADVADPQFLVDVRMNPGGAVELAALAVAAIGAGSHPYSVFKVFNRAAIPRLPGSPGADEGVKDPFHIYAPCLPLLANWGGRNVAEQYLDGARAEPRATEHGMSKGNYTTDAYYPNLGRYNAFIRRIRGTTKSTKTDGRGAPARLPTVAGDDLCTGEFPAEAYPRLMRMAASTYRLPSRMDNTIVAVGAMTASGGADTAHGLRQSLSARLVASTGDVSMPGPEFGQHQAGKVPGGDTVTLTDMVLTESEAARTAWLPGGLSSWPSQANWKASNFAITPHYPRASASATPRRSMIREFTAEPVADVIWHSNPYGALADAEHDAEHAWTRLEDATAFGAKVLAYVRDGGEDACQPGTYSALKSKTELGTVYRRPCLPSGVWGTELEAAECISGFEVNPDYFKPVAAGDTQPGLCRRINCGSTMVWSESVGFCVHYFSWTAGQVVGVVAGTIVALFALVAGGFVGYRFWFMRKLTKLEQSDAHLIAAENDAISP